MHVLNPMAGKGRAKKIKETINNNECVYMSSSADEATDFIIKSCQEEPQTCFTVYGGDGTVFKAVNALMKSGHSETASLKIVPVGSGNDFVKSFEGEKGEHKIDVMSFNDKYAVNVINMGFDCKVVQRASKIKKVPLVSGKASYILGVVGELVSKKPLEIKVTLTNDKGEEEIYEDKFLLAAIANAKWYGGGFKVAPLADVKDGLLDVVLIKNVSRRKFISIVGEFKRGELIDENGEPIEKVKDILIFKKCTKIKIEGCDSVCADGEIFDEKEIEISVVPSALNYIVD